MTGYLTPAPQLESKYIHTLGQHYLAPLGSWLTIVEGLIFVFCVLVCRCGIVGVIASYPAGHRKPPGISPQASAAVDKPAKARNAAASGAP